MDVTCSSVQSVERAMAILELLDGSSREWHMSDISRKLGIPKSTAHMLVLTLERTGYLQRHLRSRGYTLGLKVRALGQGVARQVALTTLTLPHMERLAVRTSLSVHLAIREDSQAVYIQKVDGLGPIHFDTYVGKRINLHCTAVGKIILAYEEPRFVREFLVHRSFSRHTANTITSPVRLQRVLGTVLQSGCAIDDGEEEPDVRCLAVPIFSDKGEFAGALGIAGSKSQIPAETNGPLVDAIKQAANAIHQTRFADHPVARQKYA